MDRNESGKFEQKGFGEKRTRSMRLSDEAWEGLEKKADNLQINRTDLIEIYARDQRSESDIVQAALEKFIKRKKAEHGKHPSQRGKEFTSSTRDWGIFNELLELVKDSPWELGLDEEQPQ